MDNEYDMTDDEIREGGKELLEERRLSDLEEIESKFMDPSLEFPDLTSIPNYGTLMKLDAMKLQREKYLHRGEPAQYSGFGKLLANMIKIPKHVKPSKLLF